jgi:glycine/D-amino acid oxidase-like deaminating enzyme
MRILICGGGVIGASIAWFLAKHGAKPVVIERTGVANAASGKSGGFLALDWCDGTPLAPLARRSFALHASLAEEMAGDWGYRRLETYGGHAFARAGRGRTLAWLADAFAVTQRLGATETTAQVHPARFTAAIMRAAEDKGAALRPGCVTGLARQGRRVTGVTVDGATIEGDAIVIAMGPWSILAAQWLPLPAIHGLKGHSLVFDTGTSIPAEALFAEYPEPNGALTAPEVFPRNDGTTYVCAISSETPLPVDPANVAPDPGAIERLEGICRRLSPVLAKARVLAAQACYRPVTQDGLPLIGRIAGLDNAYVATGHSVWGILNAPATGEAMAELILDGTARTVDLSPFDPARLPPLDAKSLRTGAGGFSPSSL